MSVVSESQLRQFCRSVEQTARLGHSFTFQGKPTCQHVDSAVSHLFPVAIIKGGSGRNKWVQPVVSLRGELSQHGERIKAAPGMAESLYVALGALADQF